MFYPHRILPAPPSFAVPVSSSSSSLSSLSSSSSAPPSAAAAAAAPAASDAAPAAAPGPNPPDARRDSLQANRIMTRGQSRGYEDIPNSKRDRALSPAAPHDPRRIPPHRTLAAVHEEAARYSQEVYAGRKRSSSSIDEFEGLERDRRLTAYSTDSELTSLSDSPSQVCLCQPDPKVPRPRNAFILFRQHHQAEVAKHHPGLANPEISKIIGEYWQRSPAEVKNRWKNLAEEEKLRHQKQYPDYRYQPRRGTRLSLSGSIGSEAEEFRCPKCGGRSMSAPRLPSPIPRSQEPSNPMHPPTPSAVSAAHSRFNHYVRSPGHSRSSYSEYRPVSGSSNYGSISYNDAMRSYNEPSPTVPVSPESKRRRQNHSGAYISGPPRSESTSARHSSTYEREPLPSPMHDHRRSVLVRPPPEYLPKHYSMAVTPRTSLPSSPRTTAMAVGNGRSSPGLTLAPLRIVNQSPSPSQNSHTKAVEAMVMSIPFLNKIKVLAKISPPLAAPGPASPPLQTRGAIIAVEGTDNEALKTVINYLRDLLQRDEEHRVRLFYKSSFPSRVERSSRESSSDSDSASNVGSGSSGSQQPQQQFSHPSFAEWLKLIHMWHAGSQEISHYITTLPPSSSPQVSPKTMNLPAANDRENGSTSTSSSKRTSERDNTTATGGTDQRQEDPDAMETEEDPGEDPEKTPRASKSLSATENRANAPAVAAREEMEINTIKPRTPLALTAPKATTTSSAPQSTSSSSLPSARKQTPPPTPPAPTPTTSFSSSKPRPSTKQSLPVPVPVAIIPRYQLSLTDAAAASVPIADEYSPADHWQWMATLWRGIVGPDVTIVVRGIGCGNGNGNGNGNGSGNGGNGVGVGSSMGRGGSGMSPGLKHVYPSKGGGAASGFDERDTGGRKIPVVSASASSPSPATTTTNPSSSTSSSSRAQPLGVPNPPPSASATNPLLSTQTPISISTPLPEVEVRLQDFRTVVLRCEESRDGRLLVGESGLRRVGFEVGEWLRAMVVKGEATRERGSGRGGR